MSIATLKKVSLCGLLKDKDDVLNGLQELGCMHLLPLRPAPAEVENVASPKAESAHKALRFLTEIPQKRRQVVRDPAFDVEKFVEQVLDVKQRLRDVTDRRDFLEHRIGEVEPWGDLVFPPQEKLDGHYLWFYVLPLGKVSSLDGIDLPWAVIRTDHRVAHVVVIAKEEPPRDLLPVPRTRTGALPLSELREHLENAEIEIEDLVAQRQALTRFIYLLSVNLADAENRASLTHADQQTRDESGIVAVQGWVPVDAIADIEKYTETAGLACLIEEPRRDEEPPTLLVEPPDMAAGADLAMFYQIPNYRSWDPSVMLFFSFSIFFAMILSDAGYGLVLMAGLLAYWKRLGGSQKGRSYRVLGVSLFGCSIIYGALAGSYFGVTPEDGTILSTLRILDVNDYQTMMKISIVIGVCHLVVANGIIAFLNRTRLLALAKLGWIAGLIGGLLLAFSEAGGTVYQAGLSLIAGGLVAVFLFSSERGLSRKPIDYLWRAVDGVKALTGIMGMFGDVLSYMRLFALGLASASLALTFNNLAMQIQDSVPGLGLLFAILLLIIGHVLNLGLSIMSGVVHGLRLNFMEFYKYAMPEEGKAFRSFARKEAKP